MWDREDIVSEYLKNNIPFKLCYPDEVSLKSYSERFRKRGNSEEYISWKLAQYPQKVGYFNTLNVEKILLHNNETLEEYLLKNNYELTAKQ